MIKLKSPVVAIPGSFLLFIEDDRRMATYLTIDGRELEDLSYEGGNERNAPAFADPHPIENHRCSPFYGESRRFG